MVYRTSKEFRADTIRGIENSIVIDVCKETVNSMSPRDLKKLFNITMEKSVLGDTSYIKINSKVDIPSEDSLENISDNYIISSKRKYKNRDGEIRSCFMSSKGLFLIPKNDI